MSLQSWLSCLKPSRQHRARKADRRQRLFTAKRRVFLEQLEDRRLLATFAEAGSLLNLDLTTDESLAIVSNGNSYALTLNSGSWTGTPSPNVSASGTVLTVTATGLAAFDTLNVTDSAAGAGVTFADSGVYEYSDNINIMLDSGPTAAVQFTGSSSFTLANSISVTTTRNIELNSGASVTTVNGNLSFDANTTGTGSGNFIGIDIIDATAKVTGSGQLMLDGHGGDTGGSNYGIAIRSGSQVIGGTSLVMVDGNGGDAAGNTSDRNFGVYISGTGSQVTSGGGDMSVTGTGGGVGSSLYNYGVNVESGGEIRAGAMGLVTVVGNGGNTLGTTARLNYGVIVGGSSRITSGGGDVSVTGNGGGAGSDSFSSNLGTVVNGGGEISAGGIGTVKVFGNGGNTMGAGGRNMGVQVSGQITSGGGDVLVTGTGGGGAGSSSTNIGVYVIGGGAKITAGNTGTVTVRGDGGNTSGTGGDNLGIQIRNGGEVTSGGGDVWVKGTGGGGGSGAANHGVSFQSVGKVTAGLMGNVTVVGMAGGGAGSSRNWGIDLNTSQITSSGGDVSVTGTGGGTARGFINAGVWIQSDGEVTAGLMGKVKVVGYGSTMTESNFNPGVRVETGGQITSGGGEVSVTGTGGSPTGYASGNYGVDVQRTGKITAGLMGSVTVVGYGGNMSGTNGRNDGVIVSNLGLITSSGGDVSITGIQGDAGANAIRLETSAIVSGDGSISLDGTGNILVTTGASIAGLGHLTVDTTGVATFDAGTTSTYSGTTTLASGRTNVDGLIDTNSSLVTVQSGATLGGNGTVDRPIMVDPGGAVAPGLSPGILTVESVEFTATSAFDVEIGGTTAGIGTGFHDQLDVAGLVTIGSGATLNLSSSGSFTPIIGQAFMIIDNNGTDAIVGTFAGLAEGSAISDFLGSGLSAVISYAAGTDNNDVVLSVVDNQPPMIISGGGGDTAAVSVSEGSTTVTNVNASDPDNETENGGGLTYSLTGLDNALFSINVHSGELTFNTAPDFEDPQDDGGDNIYDVTVTVSDAGGLTDSQDIAVSITNVNEAPSGADNTLTILEDGTLTFTTADFGFSDPDDLPANSLLAVTITTLPAPTTGLLTLSGGAVAAGQSVSAAGITSGLLKYDPVANEYGIGYASFTFQVQDDGGTVDGGVDLDASADTITIDVTSVNDAPTVVTPIANVDANQNDPDQIIVLSNVFDDVDVGDMLTLTVLGNTNGTLVSASIMGTTLTLDFLPDQSGTADITVRATDIGGLYVEDTFTVGVLSAQDQLENMLGDVQALIDGGSVNGGQGNAVSSNLQNAIDALDQGNVNSGVNKLQAFVNQVNAFINSGVLTAAEGQPLIDAANSAIASALPGLRADEAFVGNESMAAGITADDVQFVFGAAIESWQNRGVDTHRLDSVNVYVANLPSTYLGVASTDSIWIDVDAAGYGWSLNGSGGMDLLSTVTHELGHVLGFDHDHGAEVMSATLDTSQRRVPSFAPREFLTGFDGGFDMQLRTPLALTPLSSYRARLETSRDAFFSRFEASDGWLMRRDKPLASRSLALPIALDETTTESDDAKLSGAFDEHLPEDDLVEFDFDWKEALDQSFGELEEPA